MTASLAVNDRLGDLLLCLEKVDGTLATILDVGSEESVNQPSPKQLLGMLQLLADVVTPACEELEAIIRETDTHPEPPILPQVQKARVNKKGR